VPGQEKKVGNIGGERIKKIGEKNGKLVPFLGRKWG